jgi:hypothetical protein
VRVSIKASEFDDRGIRQLNSSHSRLWGVYGKLAQRYTKIPLNEERALIAKAQRGSRKSRDEIVFRHIGFVIFRLHRKLFPQYLKSYGPELLSASIPILYQKIRTYDLAYKDREGRPKPVKFASYIWKCVDGFIIKSIKEEIRVSGRLPDDD